MVSKCVRLVGVCVGVGVGVGANGGGGGGGLGRELIADRGGKVSVRPVQFS